MNGAQKSFVFSLALLSSYPIRARENARHYSRGTVLQYAVAAPAPGLAGVPIHPARGTPHAWGDTS